MSKKKKAQIVSIIVCMSKNRCIGKDNKIPWHIPEDLRLFKKTTVNHTVIMGRKTYESIGKALPNRSNIVLTKNQHYQANDSLVCHNLLELQTTIMQSNDDEIFVIGGQEIYKLFLPMVDKIYISLLKRKVTGNAFFPHLPKNAFKTIHQEEIVASENFEFQILERI